MPGLRFNSENHDTLVEMKTIAEILLNIKEDPDKEQKRQETLVRARRWEESNPAEDADRDMLVLRLETLLPRLTAAQRQVLQALLDSWEA